MKLWIPCACLLLASCSTISRNPASGGEPETVCGHLFASAAKVPDAEIVDLAAKLQNWEQLTRSQKDRITAIVSALKQRLDRETPSMPLPEFDYLRFTKTEKEDVQSFLESAQQDDWLPTRGDLGGSSLDQFVMHALFGPAPERVQEIDAVSSLSEIDRIMTARLGWIKVPSQDGSFFTYSNAGLTQPIRLSRQEVESSGSVPEGTKTQIKDAITKGSKYTSESAFPYLLIAMLYAQDMRRLFVDSGWKAEYNPRSRTSTYTDPKNGNKLTLYEPRSLGYKTPLPPEVQEAIIQALQRHVDYIAPDAETGLQRIGAVLPEEVNAARSIVYVDDWRDYFEQLGWTRQVNARSRNITYTNPVTGKSIVYHSPDVPIGGMRASVSPEVANAIADALEQKRDYVSPEAVIAQKRIGSVSAEEVREARSIQYIDDFRSFFEKLGWNKALDERSRNYTFTNPVTGRSITYHQPNVSIGGIRAMVSAEDSAAMANALEQGLDYVSPGATAAMPR